MPLIIYCLFLLTFISCGLNEKALTQSIPSDSLIKYSYRTHGYVETDSGIVKASGTGFFYKYKNKLYFITAKHNLSGCIQANGTVFKDSVHPNSLMIMSGTKEEGFASIDIRIIKDTASCLPVESYPDIIAVPINSAPQGKIYSVEEFVESSLIEESTVQVFGFPASQDIRNGREFAAPASSLHWEGMYHINNLAYSGNYRLINENKDIDLIVDLRGYSGSPVFIKNERTGRWHLVGALSGGNNKESNLVIAKLHFALFEIERESNRAYK